MHLHLDIRCGEGTDHCGEAEFADVQVNTLSDGREQLIAPASSFHLPSNSHCRCANSAGYETVFVCTVKRELK